MTFHSSELTAKMEPFDSFWEGPANIDQGYRKFAEFYRVNYLPFMPTQKTARILVVSCGPGYFVQLLHQNGYNQVTGIDSDPKKIQHALAKDLSCEEAHAFEYLQETEELFDVIFCEQELNHLTKLEILEFLTLCKSRLKPQARLVVHGLNGSNPSTGAEALAQNFDHYNTFTEYSLRQALEHCGFPEVRVFPLNLYVFYKNPLNYILIVAAGLLALCFRALFIMYGKSNKIFTKKIAACAINA